MKLIAIKSGIKSFAVKSCRWSIGASLLLYSILFGSIMIFQIPLKSDDKMEKTTFYNDSPREQNNILEYLHKLHNLKGNQEIRVGEREIIQPFYTVEEVFRKADYNHDDYLDLEELSKWINAKTQEHIHEAIVENYKIFVTIDVRPKNGLISWDEYYLYFLHKIGINQTEDTDYNDKFNKRLLGRKINEAIMRAKASWIECAKNDPDHLTLDEFLSFMHPESSYSMIISVVDEIYKKFDRDGDEILTEDEFSTLQSEEGEFEKPQPGNQEERERRKEFREMVDLNKDGKATRREVLTYIDPKNPRHAKEEAETLIGLADLDKDGRLSLLEIFNKMDLFLGSKMIDTARSFHDEL